MNQIPQMLASRNSNFQEVIRADINDVIFMLREAAGIVFFVIL